MLIKKILYLLVLLPTLVLAQTQTANYIKTTTYKNPAGQTPVSQTTYFDGLGRPVQQIAGAQSATGKDIVTHITYDAFGRQAKEFLPYASSGSTGAYDASAGSNVLSYYSSGTATQTGNPNFETTTNPFSEKLLEASPLNRVFKQAAPGNDWAMGQGHEVKLDYQTNVAGEVKYLQAKATWNSTAGLYDISIADGGYYTANQLYKTATTDENNDLGWLENKGRTEEFKNKEGQVVLKRTYVWVYRSFEAVNTYYVYDQFGNLTYVLPPLAEGNITQTTLDGLAYQYKYDYRNRLVEKKIPGKQWEFIVYDKLDRVVATGPAGGSATGWMITKYDAFNRPIYTGCEQSTTVSSVGRNAKQTAMNALITSSEVKSASLTTINGVGLRYSNTIAPTSFEVLTVNYYDDYDFPNAPAIPTTLEGQTVFYNTTTKPKGLPTGSWVKVLSGTTPIQAELSYTLYDYKARPIRTFKQTRYGGYLQVDSNLDFVGKPLYTITRHKRLNSDVELKITENFTYSAQDRLLTHTHQINSGVVQVLASNTYDELGQLISKNVGGLQKVDYAYNIRGWLTEINKVKTLQIGSDPKDLFGFKIGYNKLDPTSSATSSLYNGNIAETFWSSNSDGGLVRGYNYYYDWLNRLRSATYQKSGLGTNAYGESQTYDKNGNILSLQRNTSPTDAQLNTMLMDDLSYSYNPNSPNQLMKVTESTSGNRAEGFIDGVNTTDDYTYDANGNMATDVNKDIRGMYYNHLNLLTTVRWRTIGLYYLYNALGQKVQSRIESSAKDNLDGFEYSFNIGGSSSSIYPATLSYFPMAEGFIKNTVVGGVNTFSYIYNYTDHLGNVRVSYEKDATTGLAKIVDDKNYYPFGLQHKGYNNIVSTKKSPFQFNGKQALGFGYENMIDYGWRNYMPDIGRWSHIDPLAEKMRRWSPYCYAFNNPMRFVDPDGMAPIDPTWFKNYIQGAWKATANLAVGVATSTYNSGRNAVHATQSVASAYNKGGVSGAAKEYVNQVYQTSGAKSAVQTLQKASTGDAKALATTVVNVAAVALTHQIAKGSVATESSTMSNLSNAVRTTANELSAGGRAPATVVGAELGGQTTIATSGAPPSSIAPQLNGVVGELGGVGTKTASGNTVGCCAEFQAGNQLLLENPSASPSQINFTDAIRPRTGQVVPMCENCQTTFGK
jgi:RHS repeat-associated protein